MPIYHMLAIIELLFIFLYYDKLVFKNNSKVAFLWALLIFNFIDTLFFESIYTFNSISWSVNTVVLIFLGLLYYYRLYQNMEGIQIERYPNFYITAGFLVYASGSFFTYLLAWKILSKAANDFFHNGWLIQSVANFAKNIAVGYGLWLTKQN